MVCLFGSVKMFVMARVLASRSFSAAVTERAGHQKLVAQYIQKELLEADDSNLLNEEDMHLFGLNPLTDPLHLVCCNSCKKPVKASHFVVHTELCRSLGSAEEMHSELDGGTGNRKPPKRERKKLATARNQVTSTGPPERFADFDASQTAVSRCQLDELVGVTSCLGEAKETPGKISGLHVEMIPSTKRPKLVVSDVVQTLDAVRTEEGVNITTSFMEPLPCAGVGDKELVEHHFLNCLSAVVGALDSPREDCLKGSDTATQLSGGGTTEIGKLSLNCLELHLHSPARRVSLVGWGPYKVPQVYYSDM